MTGNCGQYKVWKENIDGTPEMFAGLFQLYSDATATTLECIALVAYLVQSILLRMFVEVGNEL